MDNIVALAYCSRPVKFSFDKTDEILAASRRNNATAGVTGALIYDDSAFLQWLEGDEAGLRAVFERISRDPRHESIKLLSVRKLEDRLFPDWSMMAAVTEAQALRGLKLVPHISLKGFAPFGWSEADAISFIDALSDYLTRRPAAKSEPAPSSAASSAAENNPIARLDAQLRSLH